MRNVNMGLMWRTSSQEASNVDERSHGVSLLGESIYWLEGVRSGVLFGLNEESRMGERDVVESPSFYRRLQWQNPHATNSDGKSHVMETVTYCT